MRKIGLIFIAFFCYSVLHAQIDVEKLKKHIYSLADDSMEGRNTATPGGAMAAKYIAQEFSQIGLTTKTTNNSFLQAFTYYAGKEYQGKNYLTIGKKNYELNKDYYAINYSSNGLLKGAIVNVNQGLELPKESSDFENIKLIGKVAMIDIGYPAGFDPHSENAKYADIPTRIDNAIKYGAKGIIFYKSDTAQEDLSNGFDRKVKESAIPIVYIKSYNASLTYTKVNAEVSLKKITKTADNIVGFINNNKPYTIVIGAHYDHLGYGENGNSLYRGQNKEIHNGADDNASGVASIIEIARNLKNSSEKNYNYLILAFSGEELGLYGSKSFVENISNQVDSAHIACMINLDMVGRLGEKDKNLEINGIGTAAEWSVILKNISIDNIRVKEGMNGIGPSDHTSFYLNNIPVLHFFTGQHEDYHKPTDDAAKINFEGMSKVCQYIIAVVMQLNSLPKLSYIKTKEDNNENTPKFKVTLGVIPDYMFDGEGMRIDGVTEGKAASKAGLIKGDIVTQLGELQVTDMSSYMKALSQFTKGQQTTVTFIRDREKKQSNITF
ncbi:MAG: M20/M25/M40 family metallo-hydrolase [Bacteroidota bacterium]